MPHQNTRPPEPLSDNLILASSIRISKANVSAEDLRAKANAAALDPKVFEEADPFFWEAEASNNSVDSYGTRMMPSTLQRYAADATDGRSYLVGHNIYTAPIGRTLLGEYTGPQGNGMARTDITSFTVPGLTSEGMTSDSLIHGIRSGMYMDVSVGFMRLDESKMICSICGGDMLDWLRADEPCYHIPKFKYPVLDKNGKKTGKEQMAIANMEDFGLRELSTVYKGATTGAQVKAIRLAEAGLLDPVMANWVEETHRIDLPGNPVSQRWAGWRAERLTQMHGTTHSEEERQEEASVGKGVAAEEEAETVARNDYDTVVAQRDAAQGTLRTLETAIVGAGIPKEDRTLEALVRFLLDDRTRLLVCEKDATEYRADTIKQAVESGVRAKGSAFDKDGWQKRLSKPTYDLDDIRAFRDEWEADAKNRFKPGRVTTNDDEAEKGEPIQLPARAHRA